MHTPAPRSSASVLNGSLPVNTPPQPGDHLVSPRKGYSHHGICVGHNRVIHFAGWADAQESGPIEEVDLEEFSRGNTINVVQHTTAATPDLIVQRARSRLGETDYNVFSNNCEHFCNWCVTGIHDSDQIDARLPVATALTSAVPFLATRTLIAGSGASMMSGLAAVGGFVGGGAVAGIAALGLVPAIGMAAAINRTVLAEHNSMNDTERRSRQIGRIASYAGAGAGTAGSIAAISAIGASGLSAAGITSGLATIGGLVGAGMGVGVAIATSAPLLAAAGTGYTAYKVAQAIAQRTTRPMDAAIEGSPASKVPRQ
jgi:hypothetical protein